MHGMDLGTMWSQMGPIPKAVVFVLFFMSIYSIAVGLERIIVYARAKKQSVILLQLIGKLWQQGKIEESKKVCSGNEYRNSHLSRVLAAGLEELGFQEEANVPYVERVESAKRAIERATVKGLVEFRRGLNGLATIGSTGPFVGLFGTTFGVITAFQGIAMSDSTGLGAVAAGIAEALITTAFGILVAVIAVMFFNFLLNKVDIYTGEMANASSELIDHYIKKSIGG